MKLTTTAATLALTASVAACATAPPPSPKKAPPAPTPKEQPPEPPASDELHRTQLEAVLRRGPARLLANVPIEAVTEKDNFVGWRVQELPIAWKDIELKPGDVVTSVNAMPLKTPTEFWAAWTSLTVASELKVGYLRDGAERTFSVPIVGMPSAALSNQIHHKPNAAGTKPAPGKAAEPEEEPIKANQNWNRPKRKRTIIIRGEDKPLSDTLVDWSD
ncbi:MAG: hypothetical protein JRI68_16675 [Deltaproteobacteria bacterium]|nr:hypothetical protein [Deltaproteobacteria bacterium]